MWTAELTVLSKATAAALEQGLSKLGEVENQKKLDESIILFLKYLEELPKFSSYKYIPTKCQQLQREMVGRLGEPAGRQFLYLCTLQAILNTLDSARFNGLPSRIQQHQIKQYQRIIGNADIITATCELNLDLFHKEIGLATLRLYAAAAQLIDFQNGVGRSMLLKGGLSGLLLRAPFFLKIGGFKPFFEIHTHLAYLDEFNEEGWNECYRCCAELYAVHPSVLGMYGGSWFYDPALAEISPRLAYLRQIPEQGGARLFFDSENSQATEDATATSPTRKKLFDEGKYRPKIYALIWPRVAQIHWATEQAAHAKTIDPPQ